MEAILSLICKHCNSLLMQQNVTCGIGNTATINIDELAQFAGPCCNRQNRTATVEIKVMDVTVEATTN